MIPCIGLNETSVERRPRYELDEHARQIRNKLICDACAGRAQQLLTECRDLARRRASGAGANQAASTGRELADESRLDPQYRPIDLRVVPADTGNRLQGLARVGKQQLQVIESLGFPRQFTAKNQPLSKQQLGFNCDAETIHVAGQSNKLVDVPPACAARALMVCANCQLAANRSSRGLAVAQSDVLAELKVDTAAGRHRKFRAIDDRAVVAAVCKQPAQIIGRQDTFGADRRSGRRDRHSAITLQPETAAR
jgi:hypothetical protein